MILALVFFVGGIIIGPWLGVVADRAEDRERPELDHRCVTCRSSLGGIAALIPVRSWFLRCPNDPAHPAWRYPVIDLGVGLALAAAAWRFGWSWQLGPYALFFAALVVMSVIDAETHLLLNVFTWPTAAVGLFLVLFLSGPNDHADGIWAAIVGGAFFGGILMVMHLAYPPGLGRGDVKMALSLGLFLGWLGTSPLEAIALSVWALMLASLGTALFGIGRRIVQGVKAEVPMGPALAAGTAVVVLAPGVFVGTL